MISSALFSANRLAASAKKMKISTLAASERARSALGSYHPHQHPHHTAAVITGHQKRPTVREKLTKLSGFSFPRVSYGTCDGDGWYVCVDFIDHF